MSATIIILGLFVVGLMYRQIAIENKLNAAEKGLNSLKSNNLGDFKQKLQEHAEQELYEEKTKLIQFFSKEMSDFKSEFEQQMQDALAIKKKLNADLGTVVASQRELFDKKVNKAFEDAVAKIDFDRIEYKKTITKKRRQVSRQAVNVQPVRTWRSIYDPPSEEVTEIWEDE